MSVGESFGVGSLVIKRGLISEVLQHGSICDVKPMTVVADNEALIALWAPLGIPTMVSVPSDRALPRPWLADQCHLVEATWRWRHTLQLFLPGQRWSTWVTWSSDWEFLGWYVNLQSLLCRTEIGFDERDHRLDVLVHPDGTWEWKDQHEFSRSVEVGEYTDDEVAAIRRTGTEAVDVIESRGAPFDGEWSNWRPPAEWAVPLKLPDWKIAW